MPLKFLIDNALSPVFANQLQTHGHHALHVRDVRMQHAADEDIFDFAQKEGRIIVSADTDFGTIIALRNESYPSIVIFRRTQNLRPIEQVELLLNNLSELTPHLEKGSIVIIEDKRIRIRELPVLR